MDRLNQLSGFFNGSSKQALQQKNPDDVVIVAAYRTILAKGGKGSFKDVGSDYILAKFLEQFIKKTGVDPKLIEDVEIGNVLNGAAGASEHRGAMLSAGIPYTSAFGAVNRQCSSGLIAISDVANKIKTGEIDVGIGGGSESMSKNYGPQSIPKVDSNLMEDEQMNKCLIPMGITNENVAEKFSIPRKDQDEFAAASYQKAEKAVSSGAFADEILPIESLIEDPEDDEKYTSVTATKDEGVRPGVTAAGLGKIRPAFKGDGTTTAGNSSQVTDGAAAVLLMRRSVAEKHGYPIVAKYIQCSSVGVPPEIMGVGPAYAIPDVLKKTGLTVDDIAVFEINEAFAAQALYSIKTVGIPIEKVNPNGGAIALGHPLGCTGARQYATILRELKKGEFGVTSMCIGTGMGAASVLLRE